MPSQSDIDVARRLAQADHGLAVIVTQRRDRTPACSVVNAGIMNHPVTNELACAFVSRGDAKRLQHLRATPRATAVFRWGWQWAAVEGETTMAGPKDDLQGLTDALPQLLRNIFVAAGGNHENWDEYDRVMKKENRIAVFIALEKIYSNR